MYALSRRFYPKRLTVHSGYNIFQYVCSLGIEPITFCAANAMLYQRATGTQLYPDIPWDAAFGRFYTNASESKAYYIHIYALHMCNGPLLTIDLTLELTYTGKRIR